ncbi:MAG: bifunctional N-acetylglucosamine-1-phosphate uridyltransferase/glucosamine-1-phosphate acetyltransferase [Proteobacteria bacterium]|nr:bifunctional N-acetylglucosamine-1-phosphate uridyltransferase/glucosamine-1-phosphate acetyltransferase [Pseudomonadota bacterium]
MTDPVRPPAALILAAGKGTRMKSDRPKVLFEVLGRSLVRRVVDAAREAGCEDVVVVVGHQADRVEASLADVEGLVFATQRGMNGTGQAVAHARDAVNYRDRTVVVLPGDVPLIQASTVRELLEAHSGAVTVATMVPPDAHGYGRVVRADDGGVVRIVEHRDATEQERAIGEVNTSIYAFDGSFLFGADGQGGAVSEIGTDNDQGEQYLTDVVGIAVGKGETVGGYVIEDAHEVAGINDRAQLADLEAGVRTALNRSWLQAGVTMEDPDDVRIEEGVRLEQDVTLGAAVELRGTTTVASGASIARGCVLTDTHVGADATLGPYVVLTSANVAAGARVLPFTVASGLNEKKPHLTTEDDRVLIGEGARVGPFSHLRQAADLGPDVHVGNFVELKKTRMHDGAKANHLAYLGDAEIGGKSNIGAGVITCNYDGFGKHKTTIGEGAFIGTDSHLVAPVKIGDGAYVATGTTVTRNVPADALAIGRARMENKDGYASKIRNQLKRRADRAKARVAAAAEAAEKPSS